MARDAKKLLELAGMAKNGCIWLYMAVYGCKLLYMAGMAGNCWNFSKNG